MRDDNIPRPQAPMHLKDCVVYARRNLIVREQVKTNIEPKVMDVLCVMVAQPDDVLSREEIIDQVWGGAAGADERLTRAVSQLRKALGDAPRSPRFIETVPKRGYRLVCPVALEADMAVDDGQPVGAGAVFSAQTTGANGRLAIVAVMAASALVAVAMVTGIFKLL